MLVSHICLTIFTRFSYSPQYTLKNKIIIKKILEAADKIQEQDMKSFALKIVRNNFPGVFFLSLWFKAICEEFRIWN